MNLILRGSHYGLKLANVLISLSFRVETGVWNQALTCTLYIESTANARRKNKIYILYIYYINIENQLRLLITSTQEYDKNLLSIDFEMMPEACT